MNNNEKFLKRKPLVSVYVTCHNYGRFLRQSLDSVINQSLDQWELFIMNDGSSDDSEEIAQLYVSENPGKIELISTTAVRGLRTCANDAIQRSRGKYIIRLDADDYFDESALLVMVNYLEAHQDIGLVYSNWIYISEDGGFLGVENRKKVGQEAKVLDLPAHGACTMIRRRVIKSVGGYDPAYDSQDGHELWLKVLDRYKVGNIETALFYYRQHGGSMSRDERRLLGARQKIKRGMAAMREGHVKPRIVAVIPAKNSYPDMPNVVLEPLAGIPLIDYTLREADACGFFEHIFVSTDDPAVVNYCSEMDHVIAELRTADLSAPRATLADVLAAAIDSLESEHDIHPDIVVLLSIHSPLRRAEHIREAIDTLTLYDVDNVISIYEDQDLHFLHGENGLEPLNAGIVKTLRFEREALFVDNGSVHALWRDFAREEDLYQGRVGHIVMPRDDSFQIKSSADREFIEFLISQSISS